MKTFKTNYFTTTIFSILSVLFLAKGIYAELISTDSPPRVAFLALGFISLFGALITSRQHAITFKESSLIYDGIEVHYSEIEGFTTSRRVIHLKTTHKNAESIFIDGSFEESYALKQLIRRNFKDLDKKRSQEIVNEAFNSLPEVHSVETNDIKLLRIKLLTWTFNVVAIFASIAGLFQWFSAPVFQIIGVLVPIACVFWVRMFKGLVIWFFDSKSPLPSVVFALFGNLMLFPMSVFDGNSFISITDILPYTLLFGIILGVAIYYCKSMEPFGKVYPIAKKIFFPIICLGYGVTSTIHLNQQFDKSVPTYYKSVVVNMHLSGDKRPTPIIEIAPWQLVKRSSSFSVSKAFFNYVNVGDSVYVAVFEGGLKIPFFKIASKVEKSKPFE